MQGPVKSEILLLREPEDLVRVRLLLREWMAELEFDALARTKILTAASELSRNTLIHGGGGTVLVETCEADGRQGLRLTFEDRGKGIPDIESAMKNGFTTGKGLGLGLGGSRRLMNEFTITSSPGAGTRITVTQWV
jgi:serine/threonine-protein kinase RsbT